MEVCSDADRPRRPRPNVRQVMFRGMDKMRHRDAFDIREPTATDFAGFDRYRQIVLVTYKRSVRPSPSPINPQGRRQQDLRRTDASTAKVKRIRNNPSACGGQQSARQAQRSRRGGRESASCLSRTRARRRGDRGQLEPADEAVRAWPRPGESGLRHAPSRSSRSRPRHPARIPELKPCSVMPSASTSGRACSPRRSGRSARSRRHAKRRRKISHLLVGHGVRVFRHRIGVGDRGARFVVIEQR